VIKGSWTLTYTSVCQWTWKCKRFTWHSFFIALSKLWKLSRTTWYRSSLEEFYKVHILARLSNKIYAFNTDKGYDIFPSTSTAFICPPVKTYCFLSCDNLVYNAIILKQNKPGLCKWGLYVYTYVWCLFQDEFLVNAILCDNVILHLFMGKYCCQATKVMQHSLLGEIKWFTWMSEEGLHFISHWPQKFKYKPVTT